MRVRYYLKDAVAASDERHRLRLFVSQSHHGTKSSIALQTDTNICIFHIPAILMIIIIIIINCLAIKYNETMRHVYDRCRCDYCCYCNRSTNKRSDNKKRRRQHGPVDTCSNNDDGFDIMANRTIRACMCI